MAYVLKVWRQLLAAFAIALVMVVNLPQTCAGVAAVGEKSGVCPCQSCPGMQCCGMTDCPMRTGANSKSGDTKHPVAPCNLCQGSAPTATANTPEHSVRSAAFTAFAVILPHWEVPANPVILPTIANSPRMLTSPNLLSLSCALII
jgi:hypothetical protein